MRLTDPQIIALGEEGFFVRDGLLGAAAARDVARELDAVARAGGLRPAGVSRGARHRLDADTRGDAIAWLSPDASRPALAALAARFTGLRDALNREAYLGLDRVEVQLARYPGDGARYRRHRDAFPGGPNRRLTAIYYANPDWRDDHGGLLRLHLPGGPLDVAPVLDRLVVFLSERLDHEVLPAFAPRRAVTAWFYGRDDVRV